MGEGFKKFKRRIILNTWIRSILCGASCGLAAIGATMIVDKIADIGVRWTVYVLICAVGMLAAWFISFLLLRQSNGKISKRLDRQLGLNEKVQTMLEFCDDSGCIVELQREDTNSKLEELPTKGFALRRVWVGIIALVLSAAVLVFGILMPKKQQEAPYDPDYNMSEWQTVSLENLIQYVRNSRMQEDAKGQTVKELEGLLASLTDATKESQKKELVVDVIVNIKEIVDNYNAYGEVSSAMRESNFEHMMLLSEALNEFVHLPKSDSYDQLSDALDSDDGVQLSANISRFSQELQSCLRNYQDNKNAPLFVVLDGMYRDMEDLSKKISSNECSVETGRADLKELFSTASDELHVVMSYEYENESTGNYAVSELMRIFGITDSDLPATSEKDEESPGLVDDEKNEDEDKEDDDDKELSDGGIGTGELIFGSDDIIYHPDDEAYVMYGEVLNDYYLKKIYEKLIDGNVSDEMRDYINNYLDMLIDGSARD